MPKSLAYARCSDARSDMSIDTQSDLLDAACQKLWVEEGVEWNRQRNLYVDEGRSAFKTAWNKRPGMVRMVAAAERGDHIWVWRLSRVDRNYWRQSTWINWTIDNNLALHVLECFGGKELDPEDMQTKLVASVLGLAGEMESREKAMTTKVIHDRLRKEGRATNRPRRLMKLDYVPNPSNPKEMIAVEVPDLKMIRLIKEAAVRRAAGETYHSIAKDLRSRGVKCQTGSGIKPLTLRYYIEAFIKAVQGGDLPLTG